MDVRAILIVGRPLAEGAEAEVAETIAETPMAFCDIVGRPVLHRIFDRLKTYGIDDVAVIGSSFPIAIKALAPVCEHVHWIEVSADELWRSAGQMFEEQMRDGADLVLVFRIGPYSEIDLDDLIRFHLESRAPVTSVVSADGLSLEIFAASLRTGSSAILVNCLENKQSSSMRYVFTGYFNRLMTPLDLRQLAVDSLMQRNAVHPVGQEMKPGVWVGDGATIHKRARILSPAYIGAHVRVRAAAVITRCTSLEQNSIIDCGTVADNMTALPYTYVGAGLDVSYAIVGSGRLWYLKKNVVVEITDSQLIDTASHNAVFRAVSNVASLLTFVPVQFLRGLFVAPPSEQCANLPQSVQLISPALKSQTAEKTADTISNPREFSRDLAIARRYGND